jgi:hypothetical protein
MAPIDVTLRNLLAYGLSVPALIQWQMEINSSSAPPPDGVWAFAAI